MLYYCDMKTAISIPNDVFARVEDFVKRKRMSRSALFTIAVDQYVQQHRTDDVTQRLNEVYANENSSLDPVLATLQSQSLPREEW